MAGSSSRQEGHHWAGMPGSSGADDEAEVLIVDLSFPDHFQLPRGGSPGYTALLSCLPQVFVGTLDLLEEVVRAMAKCMAQEYADMVGAAAWLAWRGLGTGDCKMGI